jgi:hypothetical protein
MRTNAPDIVRVFVVRRGRLSPTRSMRSPIVRPLLRSRRERLGMPKIGSTTKAERDRTILAGLDALFDGRTHVRIMGTLYTRASLAALFDEHLTSMARLRKLTAARRQAMLEERKLEKRVRRVAHHIKQFVAGEVGVHDPRMLRYGFRPDRKPHMSAETKRRANEKRQRTRRERGITSKKRR